MKATKSLQTKLEDIFDSLEYRVRYEKGTFRSGHCILEEQNVVVVNKFYPLESKINALVEILRTIDVDYSLLDDKQTKLVQKINQTEIQF